MTVKRHAPAPRKQRISHQNTAIAERNTAQDATNSVASNIATKESYRLLPLGAMLLAGGLSVAGHAQTAPSAAASPAAPAATSQATPANIPEVTLKPVIVRDTFEQEGKDSIKVKRSTTAKGNQELRDIPQSITVVTEKLIDDRNLDTLKEVLHNTAGVTFQAAEGGEEDIRLRGFSLAGTGDIFLDGMRDPAFYERDTFAVDRVDLLRGSASMLFGRGSTGGAANQVSKQAHTFADNEMSLTVGSHNYVRTTGDFNFRLGESSAMRINAMSTSADTDGRGNGLQKKGLALSLRTGIGEKHEFSGQLYWLDNKNPRMNYGLPWLPVTTPATGTTPRALIPGLSPDDYYGMNSDRNASGANLLSLGHIWHIDNDTELKTQFRRGLYTRDQRASTVRFVNASTTNLSNINSATLLSRGTQLKIQDMQVTQLQSDFSTKFQAAGYKHDLLAGVDYTVEDKSVEVARTAAQGGVVPVKSNTTLGGVVTGGVNSINEDARVLRDSNDFRARGRGIYVQDTWHLNDVWKVLAGLRYDSMTGVYNQYGLPTNATLSTPLTTTQYKQSIGEASKRIGMLYQPNELQSFHFSYGTSFNTSGDTYSYNSTSANTPPEQSRNLEFGAKIDSANKRWTTRYAVFYAEKYNERNTDTDSAATSLLLSGKRHSAGFEFDITGRITTQWEIFGSYMWIPSAKVDKAAACPPSPAACSQSQPGEREGDRPGLIPKHSGTIWNTYQITPKWRVGAGLNFRSSQKPVQADFSAPGFGTVDLLAEYRINDQFTLKANISNVKDKYYADNLYRGHYVPGQGRVVMLNMSARF